MCLLFAEDRAVANIEAEWAGTCDQCSRTGCDDPADDHQAAVVAEFVAGRTWRGWRVVCVECGQTVAEVDS